MLEHAVFHAGWRNISPHRRIEFSTMPFKVAIATSIHSVCFTRATAKQTLDAVRTFRDAGLQFIEVTDGNGDRLTEETLEALSISEREF
jgi:hypothetical protein